MTSRTMGALALAGALLTTAACDEYRTAALDRESVYTVSRRTDVATMEWAIEASFVKRRWEVVTHKPGQYIARLQERGHSVDVAVNYDATGFSIVYLRSTNLLHEKDEDGHETIHRKYNTWIKNLSTDIRSRISGVRERPPRLPPPPPPPVEAPPAAPYDADAGAPPSEI